jgi:luciferase family oxidoreductase group 1
VAADLSPLRLGILDQSPVVAGSDAAAAIAATLALVQRADELGYERYWFAEHHGRRYGFASASPELMIARAAATTKRIRLGSGGVLLAHYPALKVAENFHLLETLAPGRIDLGIGRGTGARDEVEAALGTDVDAFERRLGDLVRYLDGSAEIVAAPGTDRVPELWLLGSTSSGARLAGTLGLPYAYAHFIKGDGEEHTAAYREAFRPSARLTAPHAAICVAAYCSPDAREREEYLETLNLRRARMQLATDAPPPTPAEARTHEPTPAERKSMAATTRLAIVTSPGDVRARLEDVAARHGAAEVLIVSVTPDYATRLRSYEAIAAAMLPARSPAKKNETHATVR